MSDILGLINLQCPNTMKELSEKRPLASEPFGAKFRLMDFALSNMVNAGIDTVGLILPFHSRSVLDHVRSAKEWDLARKQHGLYYLPMDEEEEIRNPQEGDIYSYYKNLRYVEPISIMKRCFISTASIMRILPLFIKNRMRTARAKVMC